MDIKTLKKELGLTNKTMARFFDMRPEVYQNSTAKKRYENALIRFYFHVKMIT